jgi:SAM-dependent methyltransferase
MLTLYRTLYRLGVTPWDRGGIPAPVRDLVGASRPGRAVDLGCGTGGQARYLAGHGWTVTAVDFVATAIARARRLDVDGRVTWRVADVTDISTVDITGELAGTVDLILDNGCLHGIPTDQRAGWANTVASLAAPGATLLVRAAPRRRTRGIGPQGIDAGELADLVRDRWHPVPVAEPGWHAFTAVNQRML